MALRRATSDDYAIVTRVLGRAFETALDACLSDARAVPIGVVPKDFSCVDKLDKCPDKPTPDSEADGCPSP